jgi:hypothetical protein
MQDGDLLKQNHDLPGGVKPILNKQSLAISARVYLNGNVAHRRVASTAFVYWDTELKGFGLTTRPSGVRTWFVSFRRRGKIQRKKLGRADKISAEGARKLARAELVIVALDGLPVAPKVVPDAAMLVRDFMQVIAPVWSSPHRTMKPGQLISLYFGGRFAAERRSEMRFISWFADWKLGQSKVGLLNNPTLAAIITRLARSAPSFQAE